MVGVVALLGALALGAGPEAAYRAAATDLVKVAPRDRPYVRYLALYAWPEADRPRRLKAVSFWLNSLSVRRTVYNPAIVPDSAGKPALVRLDLRGLQWDAGSRATRAADLAAAGVDLAGKDRQADFLDIWERLAKADPYFAVTGDAGYGKIVRGWLDPTIELGVRVETRSRKAVLRADWFLAQVAFDAKGYYSDFLMIPPKEADLFKWTGVDIGRVHREYLARGGAVQRSIVAVNNRGLELYPALYGSDSDGFFWRSLDVKTSVADQGVLREFLGNLRADAHEDIWSIPNGLHAYAIYDGAGNQVKGGAVPEDIAQDRGDTHDTRVLTPYKCVTCHSGAKGIWDFADVVGKLATQPDRVGLATFGKNPSDSAQIRGAVEDYYLSNVPRTIARQQESYSRSIAAVMSTSSAEMGGIVGETYNDYTHVFVDLARAGREIGAANPESTRAQLTAAAEVGGNVPEALAIAAGESVPRDAWEVAYPAIMQSRGYPWEPPPQEANH